MNTFVFTCLFINSLFDFQIKYLHSVFHILFYNSKPSFGLSSEVPPFISSLVLNCPFPLQLTLLMPLTALFKSSPYHRPKQPLRLSGGERYQDNYPPHTHQTLILCQWPARDMLLGIILNQPFQDVEVRTGPLHMRICLFCLVPAFHLWAWED